MDSAGLLRWSTKVENRSGKLRLPAAETSLVVIWWIWCTCLCLIEEQANVVSIIAVTTKRICVCFILMLNATEKISRQTPQQQVKDFFFCPKADLFGQQWVVLLVETTTMTSNDLLNQHSFIDRLRAKNKGISRGETFPAADKSFHYCVYAEDHYLVTATLRWSSRPLLLVY